MVEVANTNATGAPTWVQQLVLEYQVIAAKVETQTAEIQVLRAKAAPVPATASAPRREILPKLPTFSGPAKSELRPWLTQAYAKLEVDLGLFSESEKFWYINSRLRGKAAGQVEAWITANKRDGIYSVEALFDQLRLAYDNPETMENAARKLCTMKQEGSFAMFLPDFQRTMLEAGGLHWDDQVKKIFLNMAIAMELEEALVGTRTPATYTEYCKLLHTVSNNLEWLRARKRRENELSIRNVTGSFTENLTRISSTEDMGWSSTSVTSSSTRTSNEKRRAQWVSQATMKERREKGACFRCGGIGHRRDNCSLLLPKRSVQS